MANNPWAINEPPNENQPAPAPRPQGLGLGPVTALLIAICVVVAILSKLGANREVVEPLFISLSKAHGRMPLLNEVRHGEVWRLVTPIFIHLSIPHILFNMMMLKDLGTVVEKRFGARTLLSLVLAIGVVSNMGEYLANSPFFGGMSGVIYGLFGYIWMKSKFDPGCGLVINQQAVIIMVAWFFICLTGLVGHIANYAHGVGLVFGMAWGFLAPKTPPIVPIPFRSFHD